MSGGAWLMLALSLGLPWLATRNAAMAGVSALYFAIALTFGIATTALVSVTLPRFRGQVVALYLLLGNLVGLGLGPLFVGALLDHGAVPFRQIGPALGLVCGVVALPAALLLHRARGAFLHAMEAPPPEQIDIGLKNGASRSPQDLGNY